MKKKVALLLAAVITAAMLPINIMAASVNEINRVVTINSNEIIEKVSLRIEPKDEITSGESIILTVENAKFDYDEYNKRANEKHNTSGLDYIKYYNKGAHTWNSAMNAFPNKKLETVLNECFQDGDNELPYSITVNNEKEIQVRLFPLMASAANRDWTNARGVNVGKPRYKIPLQVIADGVGDVKVTINNNNSSVEGDNSYKFANSIFTLSYGDVDCDGSVSANDAAVVYSKVLDNSFVMPIEDKTNDYMKYVDVTADNYLTAFDCSAILQKTLIDYTFPVEKK